MLRPMDPPVDLWRALCGRPPGTWLTRREAEEILEALARVSRGFGGERSLVGRDYLDDPSILGAYLLVFAPTSHGQFATIAQKAALAPRGAGRALDLGSGPGPVARALLELGYADVRALDWSERALAVAAELGRRLGRQLGTLRWKAGQPLPPGPWDLITAGHLTNELFRGTPEAVERRADLVMSWLDALAPDGRLVLLEPASHTINREFLMLRDRLVEHSVPVLAPCFFRGPCPAVPASAACHGELRWDPPPLLQRIATAGRLDREAMGFSWLVLGKPGGEPRPDPPAGAVRVVSEQMLNKAGRQRFVVCGADGRFSLSAPKDHRGTSWGPAWRALGRGDAVVVTEPEAREAGWGLGPTTRLRPMD